MQEQDGYAHIAGKILFIVRASKAIPVDATRAEEFRINFTKSTISLQK